MAGLGVARGCCELSSLRLVRLYYRWLSDFPESADDEDDLNLVTQELKVSRDLLDNAQACEEASYTGYLYRRIAANVVSAGVYERVLVELREEVGKRCGPSDAELRQAYDQLRNLESDRAGPAVVRAEMALAAYALGLAPAQETVTRLRDIYQQAFSDSTVLTMDREEMRRFVVLIEQRITRELVGAR